MGAVGGGGGWGGRNNVPFAAFAWTFFLLPIFMLRLQAAASSLRNTACFPRKLEHKSLTESGRH